LYTDPANIPGLRPFLGPVCWTIALGWILHSVGNAFEAIVDIIGELSETV
jgi:hypothetical protein